MLLFSEFVFCSACKTLIVQSIILWRSFDCKSVTLESETPRAVFVACVDTFPEGARESVVEEEPRIVFDFVEMTQVFLTLVVIVLVLVHFVSDCFELVYFFCELVEKLCWVWKKCSKLFNDGLDVVFNLIELVIVIWHFNKKLNMFYNFVFNFQFYFLVSIIFFIFSFYFQFCFSLIIIKLIVFYLLLINLFRCLSSWGVKCLRTLVINLST